MRAKGDPVPPTRKPNSSNIVRARARELRRPLTPAEELLWKGLRNRKLGAKFRRQVPIGPFIVDFYCHETRLIVEIDGGVHGEVSQAALDAARTDWLEDMGYRVLRVTNAELTGETDTVMARIQRELPLSRGAGEG